MSIEIGPTYRQGLPPIHPKTEDEFTPLRGKEDLATENIGQPDYSTLVMLSERKTYSQENRPLEPLEPAPLTATAEEWVEYVIKRDAARAYAAENDLRGTF